jgi:hypothetical protein
MKDVTLLEDTVSESCTVSIRLWPVEYAELLETFLETDAFEIFLPLTMSVRELSEILRPCPAILGR